MKTRIITGLVAFVLFLPFLYFSGEPFFVYQIFTIVISMTMTWEILKCTGLHKNVVASVLAYATTLASVLLTRVGTNSAEQYITVMMFIYFALLFLFFVNATFSKGKISVVDSCVATVMLIYVTFAMASIILLRDLAPAGQEAGSVGAKLYLLVFFFAWIPDIGGYFFGRFFGKHKLIPDVSPKKTVEGFIGGIFSAVVVSVGYGFVIGLRLSDWSSFLLLAVLAAICAMISVCGDLLASLVKRHYGIKDYGFVFPGHGGALDRFDSVVAVAPVLYILCYIANSLGWLADLAAL